jgi:putative hydrolase of the HAD superfamily
MKSRLCVVFDIDDTLYLERDYVRSGFEAVGQWAARWLGFDDFSKRCWDLFVAGHRGNIFNETLCALGEAENTALTSALVDIYRTHVPSIALEPDADVALNVISSRSSIAVISDGPIAAQSRKAEALGLCRRFTAPMILTELLGSSYRKPHPKAFVRVQELLPNKIYVYVADNPLKDFLAPKRLGWITVRVRRSNGLHATLENHSILPDHEMPDCSRLPDLLSELEKDA